MDDEALALANAFLSSGQRSEQQTFTIPGSTEKIVITITRTGNERLRRAMRQLSESRPQSISFYGSGQVCGACGGTGRL